MNSEAFFSARRNALEAVLERVLPPAGEAVSDAMRHATLGGGKRLRPLLVYATAHCLGAAAEDTAANHDEPLRSLHLLAAAIEMVHCYSLIHDDLPAMDDAALRRGKPSCHLLFGEEMAILAGDGLQPLAFGLLADLRLPRKAPTACLQALVTEFADACGWRGMVRGQMLDMQIAGSSATAEQVRQIHELKTAALIRASVCMSALLCGATEESPDYQCLRRYGQLFGLAFQIHDDLLDVTASTASAGKTTGKDREQDKATAVRALGLSGARQRMRQLCEQARAELDHFGGKSEHLRALLATLTETAEP